MKPSREVMIERLIKDWMETVSSDKWSIETVLRQGFDGYENMTDEALKDEYLSAGLDEHYNDEEEDEE